STLTARAGRAGTAPPSGTGWPVSGQVGGAGGAEVVVLVVVLAPWALGCAVGEEEQAARTVALKARAPRAAHPFRTTCPRFGVVMAGLIVEGWSCPMASCCVGPRRGTGIGGRAGVDGGPVPAR